MKTEINTPKRILIDFEKIPSECEVFLNENDETPLFIRSNALVVNEQIWQNVKFWINDPKVSVDK